MQQGTSIAAGCIADVEVMDTDRYLSSVNAPEFIEDVSLCIESGARFMIINCAALSFLTGAGLRAFLVLARKMYAVDGVLQIRGLKRQPRRFFFACGMDSIIPLVKEETRFPAARVRA
ncbi:MAG: STAS domain-containing protein [Alphaproteobacteria bacterium]|nr:STAS domain-containing protein [Alphaproteobacteria bacterium]